MAKTLIHMAKLYKDPKIKQYLIEARELIRDEKNWCKKVPARNKKGISVYVDSPEACQFCALGALAKVAEANHGRFENNLIYSMTLDYLSKQLDWRPITDFNDDPKTTHQDILSLFDKAIQELA